MKDKCKENLLNDKTNLGSQQKCLEYELRLLKLMYKTADPTVIDPPVYRHNPK